MLQEERLSNARTVLEVIRDLFEEEEEYSHMTGDIELCGKTADDVLRQVLDTTIHNGLMNG